ncbi:MAG TPA: haloacid dehalogenase-like hydrolase [Gemmatimonadaceae bacterium]
MSESGPEPPLCVDLDGTLIEGDTLRISLRFLARKAPWTLLLVPFLLLRGRPALKAWIARRFVPDPASLVWRTEVLDFLRSERERGRRIVLTTAAHRRIGEAVCAHLGCFDDLVATEAGDNLKGRYKSAQILKSLSCKEFDYIGDSPADLPVFQVARRGYLVSPSPSLHRAASRIGRIERVFHARSGDVTDKVTKASVRDARNE